MRIQSSDINMYAQSHHYEEMHQEESLEVKEQGIFTIAEGNKEENPKQLNEALLGNVKKANVEKMYDEYGLSQEDYEKVTFLEKILSMLTGKRIKFVMPKRIRLNKADDAMISFAQPIERTITYKKVTDYKSESSMKFNASGVVKTSDGREIEFDVAMKQSKSFHYRSELVINSSQTVIDPLVINYDGEFTHLTKQKYAFDIDSDGTSDQISFLEKGSGFLAFDKNENGRIDDGRELFGPTKGDGFLELSAYDEDGNGFIDEGDSIFNKLRIWNKDDEGNDVLFALGEVGVGAIYLGNVATNYALGDDMSADGYIKKTGIFLKESGQAGTIHHVDLTI